MDLAAHRLVVTVPLDMDRAQVRSTTPEKRRMMKAIGNVPPLGLTAAMARALREAVDAALDALLDNATTTVAGGRAVERDVVDIVRRWAARREEEMFPSGQPSECRCFVPPGHFHVLCARCGKHAVVTEDTHEWLCSACEPQWYPRARRREEEPDVERDEHGRELCPTCQWAKGARTSADRFCGTCSPGAPEVACSCCGFRSSWNGAIWHNADGKTVCEGCWEMPGAGAG
jgi:hypothetical protein